MFKWNAILLWPWRFAFANRTQLCVDLSRLLIGFAFLELLTMPITQQLWTWDHFLQGGQDFELGLFVIVSCLCLVLLRAQHGRQKIRHLLALGRLLALPFRRSLFFFYLPRVVLRAAASADPPFHRSAGAFLVPLQI
ncbi:MAG TPA: hypothetical protein VHU89_13975 [Acidobacteriaceae bacterium]|jgi:hypothetical protein|nr:hypothetical protein [Acidobacteriaceae bacterium]